MTEIISFNQLKQQKNRASDVYPYTYETLNKVLSDLNVYINVLKQIQTELPSYLTQIDILEYQNITPYFETITKANLNISQQTTLNMVLFLFRNEFDPTQANKRFFHFKSKDSIHTYINQISIHAKTIHTELMEIYKTNNASDMASLPTYRNTPFRLLTQDLYNTYLQEKLEQ